MKKLFVKIGFFSSIFFLISCGGGDSSPGLEFMPNMYRSPSIETYGEHIVLRDTSYMIEGYTRIFKNYVFARISTCFFFTKVRCRIKNQENSSTINPYL